MGGADPEFFFRVLARARVGTNIRLFDYSTRGSEYSYSTKGGGSNIRQIRSPIFALVRGFMGMS